MFNLVVGLAVAVDVDLISGFDDCVLGCVVIVLD